MTGGIGRTAAGLCLVLAVSFLLAGPALAHRVNIFAWAEGGTIHTESGFPGGTPVHGGTVKVTDAETGAVILEGTTDDQGRYSFTLPDEVRQAAPDLRIVIEAGMGHRGEWPMAGQEYAPEAAASAETSDKDATPAVDSSTEGTAQVDRQELTETISRLLDEKLAPIERRLAARETEGPTLTEVVGGIGWIVGIVGLLAWFKARPRQK
jgi:nickel transport protein